MSMEIRASTVKTILWALFALFMASFIAIDIFADVSTVIRMASPLVLAAALCFARLCTGPSAGDRASALHVLGILVVGACALLAVYTQYPFFMDVALAWILQSFITTLIVAKHLEGKGLGE